MRLVHQVPFSKNYILDWYTINCLFLEGRQKKVFIFCKTWNECWLIRIRENQLIIDKTDWTKCSVLCAYICMIIIHRKNKRIKYYYYYYVSTYVFTIYYIVVDDYDDEQRRELWKDALLRDWNYEMMKVTEEERTQDSRR